MQTLEEQLAWLLGQASPWMAARSSAEVVRLGLQALLELTGSARAYALMLGPSGGDMHEVDRAGDPTPEAADRRILKVGHHSCKEQSLILATPKSQGAVPAVRQTLTDLRLQALICLPLRLDNRPFGALYADCRLPRPEMPQERVFGFFATVFAAAWDNARAFERAANDALTGLPNDNSFLTELSRVLPEAVAPKEGGILLLDLDTFKRINAAAGHEMGNLALRDVAQTLREALGADGMVARLGSDKFAVLLAPEAHTAIALRLHDVAERARATVATKNYHGVQLSASVGGVALLNPNRTAHEVLKPRQCHLGAGPLAGPQPSGNLTDGRSRGAQAQSQRLAQSQTLSP